MAFNETNARLVDRKWTALGAGGLFALILVLEFLPQNQRALLLKDDTPAQVKAFAAAVTSLDPSQSRLEGGVLRHLAAVSDGARRKRLPGQRPTDGQRVFADAGTGPIPSGVPVGANPTLTDAGLPAGSDGGSTSSTSGGIAPPSQPGPLGAAPGTSTSTSSGSSSSTVGATTSSGGASGGITTTSSGGTQTTTTSGGVTTPVSSVPEPGTWLTMLVGFFMIGAVIRRRPRSLQAA